MAVLSLGLGSFQVGGSLSISGFTLQLVNDSVAPGNNYVYGTTSGGIKGWRSFVGLGISSVAGTVDEITVTNGDGVAGNPVLSLPAALTFTGKTVTGGTFTNATVSGTLSGTPSGGTLDFASVAITLPPTIPNLVFLTPNGGFAYDGYGSIGTRTPTGWASGGQIPYFRFSRPAALPNTGGVPLHFLVTPYDYGMALEYPGVLESWVSKFSIKGNWDGLATNTRPPEFWVGDHGDTGGVFATAWYSGDGFAGSTWSEIASQSFDDSTSHGPLRLRVVSTTDSFQFRQGNQANAYPTNTDTHSVIVAELTGAGALTIQGDLSINPGASEPNGFIYLNAGVANASFLSFLSDSSQKWLVSNAGATNRFTIGKSTGAATFTEYLGLDYDTGVATFSAGIKPGTDGSGVALSLANGAALRSLSATSAGALYVDVANVTFRDPSATLATLFALTTGGHAALAGNLTVSGTGAQQIGGVASRLVLQGGTADTPANANAVGVAGSIVWGENYVYICIATNTWKRAAIATW